MNKYIFIIIFVIASQCNTYSQNIAIPDTAKKEFFLKALIHDQGKLWSTPYSAFNTQHSKFLYIAVPLITATSLAIIYDEKIHTSVLKFDDRNKGIKNTGSFITYGGNTLVALGLSGVFYFGGTAIGDSRLKETGFLAAYALANMGIINTDIKIITGR